MSTITSDYGSGTTLDQAPSLGGLVPPSIQQGSGPLTPEDGSHFDYGLSDDIEDDMCCEFDDVKPTVVLMGLKRSGKTSIRKVVFQKMSPNETLFVESTSRVVSEFAGVTSSFIDFETKEFPGQLSPFHPSLDPEQTFGRCGAVVFVIDAQDDYGEALARLKEYVCKAYDINPRIKFEVFIHKVDGLTDENKIDTQRDIFQRANDDLVDARKEQIHLSKIYVATDCTPVDMQTYELCCDMIDVAVDISCIYGLLDDAYHSPASSCDSGVFDVNSSSVIRLSTNQVLYMREVNRYLALVCVVRTENFEKQGLIDYNFQCFKKAIDNVFEVRRKMQMANLRKSMLQNQKLRHDSQGETSDSHMSSDMER